MRLIKKAFLLAGNCRLPAASVSKSEKGANFQPSWWREPMTTNGPDNVWIRFPLLLIGPDWIIRVGGFSVIFVDFPKAALVHPRGQTDVRLINFAPFFRLSSLGVCLQVNFIAIVHLFMRIISYVWRKTNLILYFFFGLLRRAMFASILQTNAVRCLKQCHRQTMNYNSANWQVSHWLVTANRCVGFARVMENLESHRII